MKSITNDTQENFSDWFNKFDFDYYSLKTWNYLHITYYRTLNQLPTIFNNYFYETNNKGYPRNML